MLAQCDLIGFIPTTNADRARAFFVGTLKLDFVTDDQFALVVRANRNNIRIVRVDNFTPLPFTILGWQVPNIEQVVKELSAAGVVFEKYPFVKDPSGIWSAPGGAKVAWFKDPDGNLLSISQHPNN
jgi:catechol 2,3-dioxygenase-like lactoylglutathione lyase family enzyme